jgi:ABC-type oligopeptide transport system substrate-binding subunit
MIGLTSLTIAQLRSRIQAGEVTPIEALEALEQRISAVDGSIHGYLSRDFEKARAEALKADTSLPLGGVPIAIKDDTDLAGQTTTYGSSAHGPAPTKDAEAVRLLREAGWEVKNNKLIETKSGKQMEFEILLESPLFERIALPFIRNLERLGMVVKLRTIDPSQYQTRLDDFDYDMTVVLFGQSLSPGNEQREYFGSAAADIPGSRNVLGIKSPAIDALIDQVIAAPDRDALIQRTRALDRALQWGHYVVPHFHSRSFRLVFWNQFGLPETPPKYGVALDSWWIDPAKQAALQRRAPGATQ